MSNRKNMHIKVSSITSNNSKNKYNLQTSKGEKWNKKNKILLGGKKK